MPLDDPEFASIDGSTCSFPEIQIDQQPGRRRRVSAAVLCSNSSACQPQRREQCQWEVWYACSLSSVHTGSQICRLVVTEEIGKGQPPFLVLAVEISWAVVADY
jgi:hypothetical protein